jgi:heat shock protein HslJ
MAVLLLMISYAIWAQGSQKTYPKTTSNKTKTTKKSLPKGQLFLSVDSELGDCEGNGLTKCMLIKPQGKKFYELYYDKIAGFNYEPGNSYNLLVKVDSVKDEKSGMYVTKYSLIKVLSKKVEAKQPEGELKTLEISEEMTACEDNKGKRKCMLAREPGKKFFEIFYETIEGFNYVEGNAYTVQVRMISIPGDAGKAMTFRYKLVKILSQTSKGVSVTPPVNQPAADVKNTPLITSGPDSTGLSGKLWQVQLFRKDTVAYDVKDLNMTLLIHTDQGRLSGKSSCNTYFAGLSFDKTKFKTTPVGSTKLYCTNVMKAEDDYFEALQSVDNYEILNNMLYLKKGDKAIIELK